MPQDFLMARHASTGAEFRGRYLGRTDVPLGGGAREELSFLAERVAPRRPGRLWSSPLRRTRESAEILGEALGLGVEVDADLREYDFGRWEGQTFDAIRTSDPEAVNRWAACDLDFAPPGGERLGDFLARVGAVIGRLTDDANQVVLAVTHGGVIRAALCRLLGLDIERQLAFDVRPAGLVAVRLYGETGVLEELWNPPNGAGAGG